MALRFHHCRCHQSLALATCQRFHLPFITVLQRFVSTIISLISRVYFKNQMYYVSTIKHTIQKKRPTLHAQNECTTPAVLHHMLYSVCYRYLKWLGIALFLRLLVPFHFGSMPLKRALMLFPSKRFLPQSHACSMLSFRYTRVTYVTCLFILVVCGTCNLYLLPPP